MKLFSPWKKNKTLHLFSLFNYKIQKYDSTCLHPELVIYTQVEKNIHKRKAYLTDSVS